MRHASEHVDEPVGEPDREPGAEDREDDERRRVHVRVDDRADDARERDRRADGEVDAAADDHEQLPEREHGDHRRLREDVADVAAREEDRRRQADDDDEDQQDQRRTGAQTEQRRLQEPVVRGDARPSEPALRVLHGSGHLAHVSPASASSPDQTGPFGYAYSSSDAGSISML